MFSCELGLSGLVDVLLQELMKKLSKSSGGAGSAGAGKLNNVVMQMRKNCNHPDLISGGFDGSVEYPPPEELIAQGGKFALMDRLLMKLLAGGHKVLIFSQVRLTISIAGSILARLTGSVLLVGFCQTLSQFLCHHIFQTSRCLKEVQMYNCQPRKSA